MQNLNVLNISGGATKIAGLLGKVEKIIKIYGYKPDIVTGVSSGALLTLPVILGKWDEIKNIVLNMNLDTIFNIKPVNDKGKLRLVAGYRVIMGKPSLGEQRNIKNIIKSIISCKEFNDWKKNPNSTDAYIGVTNYNTSDFELVNLKTLKYNEYVNYTYASTAIPVFVEPEPVLRNGNIEMLYDGGVKHHTCFTYLSDMLGDKIKKNITVYSRPDTQDLQKSNFDAIDIVQVLERTLDIFTAGISDYDERFEKLYCKSNNIIFKQSFCPKVLLSMYDTDPNRINELYLRSFNEEEYVSSLYN